MKPRTVLALVSMVLFAGWSGAFLTPPTFAGQAANFPMLHAAYLPIASSPGRSEQVPSAQGERTADAGHDEKKETRKEDTEGDEEGHRHPENWQFRLPAGDPAEGRKAFVKYECFACHAVNGESFPKPGGEHVGSELSQMGPMHPLEFFAESIMNPSAEISGKRHRAEDGSSKMPHFNEVMTVQELVDLSAYLSALRPKGMPKSVDGTGKVIAVVPTGGQVVVEHGEIKGFMDAMTMGYKVDPLSLLKGLKAGDMIRFTIDTDKKAIVKIIREKK